MQDLFDLADDLGPAKIIHVHEPSVGLQAVLVVDNIARGPSVGGIRMAADVTTAECARLARAMTLKNAAADLPHGGGKMVVRADPKMPREQKQRLLRAMASLLRNEDTYVFAPDMGTDEECMGWIRDEVGRVVGLPRELGGIPLDEIGATGRGLGHVADVALEYRDFSLDGARVVVQGFGAVGKHAARALVERGALLVAAADSRGAIHDPRGLDVDRLIELKDRGESVLDYGDAATLDADALLAVECDIWIPAARPDVIHEGNCRQMNTRLIIQGANIPVTPGAEKVLHENGVLCVPDFIANAGGVICAAMEYRGATESAVFDAIEEKLRRNTERVLERSRREGMLPRQAAVEMAIARVRKAMSYRRFSLFSTAPGYL